VSFIYSSFAMARSLSLLFCWMQWWVLQEWKSENILASLKSLIVDKCNVKGWKNRWKYLLKTLYRRYRQIIGVMVFLRHSLIESNEYSPVNLYWQENHYRPAKTRVYNRQNLTIYEIKNCCYMGTTVAGATQPELFMQQSWYRDW